MYKKAITFEDFDGENRNEEHYFYVSKAELTKFNSTYPGGLKGIVESLMSARSVETLTEIIHIIIKLSYGHKTGDGKQFIKTDEVWNEFYYSGAYDALYNELLNDGKAAADFITAILPKDIRNEIDKNVKSLNDA